MSKGTASWLQRSATQTLDPVGSRLALEGRLPAAGAGLGDALRHGCFGAATGASAGPLPAPRETVASGGSGARVGGSCTCGAGCRCCSGAARGASDSDTAEAAAPEGAGDSGACRGSGPPAPPPPLASAGSLCLCPEDASPAGGSLQSDALLAGDPCSCPPFAVKATCGKRSLMEDTFTSCPNICELPMAHMVAGSGAADKLPPRLSLQLSQEWAAAGVCVSGGPSASGSREPGELVGAESSSGDSSGGPPAGARGSSFGAAAPPDGAGNSAEVQCGALDKLHFFGVYDGHGGAQASQHCAARLHHHLVDALAQLPATVAALDAVAAGTGAEAWCGGRLPDVPLDAAGTPLGAGPGSCVLDCSGASPPAGPDEDSVSPAPLPQLGDGKPVASGDSVTSQASTSGSSSGGRSAADGPGGVCALLESALRDAFLRTDEEFSADGTAGLVGSTAVCALVGSHRVWVANCGDSRAVLVRGGVAVQMTDDHKPEREDEAERVEKAGGQVLYWNGHRVMGVLAMSRAIGDHCLRPYVIPEPEITSFRRHANDEFLLLASDGLWDVMPNQAAADTALRCMQRARAKGATSKAAARVAAAVLTKRAMDLGSRDNITVLVIDLSRSGGGGGGATACGDSAGAALAAGAAVEAGAAGCAVAGAAAAGEAAAAGACTAAGEAHDSEGSAAGCSPSAASASAEHCASPFAQGGARAAPAAPYSIRSAASGSAALSSASSCVGGPLCSSASGTGASSSLASSSGASGSLGEGSCGSLGSLLERDAPPGDARTAAGMKLPQASTRAAPPCSSPCGAQPADAPCTSAPQRTSGAALADAAPVRQASTSPFGLLDLPPFDSA